MKKLLIVLLLLCVLAGAAYFSFNDGTPTESPPNIPFKTAAVQSGTFKVEISATGVVEPNFTVEVKSKASGEVLSFPFEEGDRIKKQQLLIRLDKSDEERNVAKAQAALDSSMARLRKSEINLLLQKTKYKTDIQTGQSRVQEAEANLKESKDKLKRQQDLFLQKIVAQEALDIAETSKKVNEEALIQAKALLQVARDSIHDISVKENEIELAQADVKQAEIALAEAEERLAETEIYAPIDGILLEKLVERGQIISSGISNVSGGTPLAKLADMSRLFITADVDETDIGSVQVNQMVEITTDAFPGQSFSGKVARIAPQGVVENSITIFKVKIEILGQGRSILKPMMSANVNIINRKIKNALFVPREAVTEKDGKSEAAILVNGLPKKIEVKTGLMNPIYIQIQSGLKADQKVLVGDWKKLLEEHQSKNDKMSTMRRILFMLRR